MSRHRADDLCADHSFAPLERHDDSNAKPCGLKFSRQGCCSFYCVGFWKRRNSLPQNRSTLMPRRLRSWRNCRRGGQSRRRGSSMRARRVADSAASRICSQFAGSARSASKRCGPTSPSLRLRPLLQRNRNRLSEPLASFRESRLNEAARRPDASREVNGTVVA